MNIADFLPMYPLIEDTTHQFNKAILRKKEFYDLKLHSRPTDDTKNDPLLNNHQLIIQRFLSSHTIYDELLVTWEMGQGKSLGSIGVIEHNLQSGKYKKAIIIVKNQDLARTFYKQIFKIDLYKERLAAYEASEEGQSDESTDIEEKRLFRHRKKVTPQYQLYTHDTFKTKYENPAQWRLFNDCIVVIDEVHNITTTSLYSFYFSFLHSLVNRKILLMTGTPMTNYIYEIGKIMNLILPIDKLLPDTKAQFDSAFISESGIVRSELVDYFTGRVSYIRAIVTGVRKNFKGKKFFHDNLVLYASDMKSHQFDAYSKLASFDEIKDVSDELSTHAQEASLFVFPDGTYGEKGFKRNIQLVNKRYSFGSDIKQYFRGGSTEEKLRKIRECSCKYAEVISLIINNPTDKCFVYSRFIHGSGAILLGLLLELFEYSHANRKPYTEAKRYIILSGESINNNALIDAFNIRSGSQDNTNGAFIQVIIGGAKVSEGFTFNNLQQIHVVSPHWNMARIDQVVARGYRIGTHNSNLPPRKKVLNIYLHCALSQKGPMAKMIDFHIYKTAINKDYKIKQVERMMKVNSFDCALTRDRNMITNKDGTRDCDYTACAYECRGVSYNYNIQRSTLDLDTFKLYYADQYLEQVRGVIERVFSSTPSMTIYRLLDKCEDIFKNEQLGAEFILFILFQILNKFITGNVVFNRYYVLREHNDLYYMIDNKAVDVINAPFAEYYGTNKYLKASIQYDDILTEAVNKHLPNVLHTIRSSGIDEQKQYIKNTLTRDVQELFLENVILAKYNNIVLDELNGWIMRYFRYFIVPVQDMIISRLVVPNRIFDSGEWKDIETQRVQEMVHPITTKKIYGEYHYKGGDLDDNNNIIIHYKADGLSRVCSTFPKKALLKTLTKLRLFEIDDTDNMNTLCNRLIIYLKDNNLII